MKIRKWNIIIIILLFLIIGSTFYFLNCYINPSSYEYHYTLANVLSPNGQYNVDIVLLGKIHENAAFPVENPKNEQYDVYARVWFNPEVRDDGSMMWYDKNTKIIYFQNDCTLGEITWINNDKVIINGIELNIHNDRYINK